LGRCFCRGIFRNASPHDCGLQMRSAERAATAACPKCRSNMTFVTSTPHPRAMEMLQTTFVCSPCNRTYNYALTPEMAALYSTQAA
jgi:transposase-like protein